MEAIELRSTSVASRPTSRKAKTIQVVYWVITSLFAAMLLMGGITELMQVEEGQQIIRHLGYPIHVMPLLGLGKTLAAVALLQRRFRTIKEWAYAGVTFNLIGACTARASAGDSTMLILSPLLFLAVMFVSYFLWKRVESFRN